MRFVCTRPLQAVGAFDGSELMEEPAPGVVQVTLQFDNGKVEDESWPNLKLHWGQGMLSIASKSDSLRVQHTSNELLQLLRDGNALQELNQQQVRVKRERGTLCGWAHTHVHARVCRGKRRNAQPSPARQV